MKKFFIALLAVCLVLAPFHGVSSVKAESTATLSATKIDELTQEFCTTFLDRTSFTEACLTAAEGIAGYLEQNEKLRVEVQTFDKEVTVIESFTYVTKTITSYNVVASPRQPDKSKKTILITTNFANHYGDNAAGSGIKATGALNNAATTALVMELADQLSEMDNKYNFSFAFFSGTDEGNYGSEAYIGKYLNQDVILVINLERLGCGNTYYYTDEVKTSHGEFIKSVANGYNLTEFPTTGRVLLDMRTVDDLPYSHYAMRGDISSFLTVEKSCLELIGGDFSGLNDSEGGKVYLTNTNSDTYDNLKTYYPDYADKLAEVGQFVIDLTARSELGDVCKGAATSYKIFTQGWVARVICLGIIIILILIMIVVLHHLEKKYLIPKPPKVKIAVFGKEYEDIKENEILVDIKRNKTNDDNNVNPFDV